MKINIKDTFPFSAIAVTFLILGILLSDSMQFHFGLIWIAITVIAILIRNNKRLKIK